MRYLLNTEIGMFGVWDMHALDFIVDKATYNANLVNDRDIVSLINNKAVVLWGTGGDGHRPVEVRINPEADLSDEEKEYEEVASDEYKLEVNSGKVIIGSPEWAGSVQEEGLADEYTGIKSFELPNGVYLVKVYFLAWDFDNPDFEDKPEYVIVINKASEGHAFKEQTQFAVLG